MTKIMPFSDFRKNLWQVSEDPQTLWLYSYRPVLPSGWGASGSAGNFPYTEERPSALLAKLTVMECNAHKSGRSHFCDTPESGMTKIMPFFF